MHHFQALYLKPFLSNLRPRLTVRLFQQRNNPESYLPDGNQDLSVKPSLIHLLHAYDHSSHNIC